MFNIFSWRNYVYIYTCCFGKTEEYMSYVLMANTNMSNLSVETWPTSLVSMNSLCIIVSVGFIVGHWFLANKMPNSLCFLFGNYRSSIFPIFLTILVIFLNTASMCSLPVIYYKLNSIVTGSQFHTKRKDINTTSVQDIIAYLGG